MGIIPVRGNGLGLVMFVIGGIVAAIGGFVLKARDFQVMIAVGAVLVVIDAVVRIANRSRPKWIFAKDAGGYFFFVPVWVLGLFAIVLNLLIGFGVIKR